MNPELIYTIIFFLGVTALFIYISYRRKQDAWIGTLKKKKQVESYDEDGYSGKTTYKLIFVTDTGKKKRVSVDRKTFDSYQEGDRAEKVKGLYYPTKL